MLKRHAYVSVLACALAAAPAYAADHDPKTNVKGSEETRANATRDSAGPSGGALQTRRPPLQTGEIQVPVGGIDTSRFDPNAGEGFKGKSTSGGGIIVPRDAPSGGNTGATGGAPLSGATAPTAPRDTGRSPVGRGERGSGSTETNSGDTRTEGGANTSGSGIR